MKTYLLTCDAWDGEIEVVYNDLSLMLSLDTSRAQLSESQQIWFLRNMPRELAELQKLVEKHPRLKLTEIKVDVTFDMFWERYNEKIRSSKKKAEKAWSRLSKTDRTKAFRHIQTYEMHLHAGTQKKYAETYLNSELWNN